MTTETGGGAADDKKAGGAGGEKDGEGGGAGGTGDDKGGGKKTVAFDDHKRALDDLHRYKGKAKELQTSFDSLKSEFDTLKTKVAADGNDYKSLYDAEKTKTADLSQKTERLTGSVFHGERYRAVYPELKKAGLRDDAANLIDRLNLEEVEVEATSTGRFNCLGVSAFVEKVKAEFPYAFEHRKAGKVNSGGAGGGSDDTPKDWTPDKLVKLEKDCRLKGNMEPYHKAYKEYREKKKKQA